MATGGCGWRRVGQEWALWEPDEDSHGRRVRRSAVLELALRAEGPMLRAEHPDLGLLPHRREFRAARAVAEERAARQEQELQAARSELKRLRVERER